MKIDVKFTEETFSVKFDDGEKFKANFGEVSVISTGITQEEAEAMAAESRQEGYTEGQAAGYTEGYSKGETAGYETGVTDGKQAEYDAFWDGFQNYGKRVMYPTAFGYADLDKFFFPKYDIVPEGASIDIFRGATGANIDIAQRLEDCGVTLDTSKMSSLQFIFAMSVHITRVPTISFEGVRNTDGMHGAFKGATALKTIDKVIHGVIDFRNSTFQNCSALENISFEEIAVNSLNLQWSTKLTHDSLMSIINALVDKTADTSGTAWTVTLGEANKAKLTDSELTIARNKGWTVN